MPYVQETLKQFASLQSLTNDQLRNKTNEFRERIQAHLKDVNATAITGRPIHLSWQYITERRTEGADIGEEWSGGWPRLRLEQTIHEG